jgi:hypothetical protein
MRNLKFNFLLFFFLLQIINSHGAGRWIAKNEIKNEYSNENNNNINSKLDDIITLDNIIRPNAIGWSPEHEVIFNF